MRLWDGDNRAEVKFQSMVRVQKVYGTALHMTNTLRNMCRTEIRSVQTKQKGRHQAFNNQSRNACCRTQRTRGKNRQPVDGLKNDRLIKTISHVLHANNIHK